MYHYRCRRAILSCTALFVFALILPSDMVAGITLEQEVREYCDSLASPNSRSRYIAADTLRKLPDDIVANALVERIETDSQYKDKQLRMLAFDILLDAQAQDYPKGLDLFEDALKNKYRQSVIIRALGNTREGSSTARVAAVLTNYLLRGLETEASIDTMNYYRSAIQSIGRLGPAASQSYPLLRDFVLDTTLSFRFRVTAFGALFNIQGFAGLLESIGDLDEFDLGDTVGMSGWQVVQQVVRRNDLACKFMLNETDRAAFYRFAEGYLNHESINEPDGDAAASAIRHISSIVSEIQFRRYEQTDEAVKWWQEQLVRIEQNAVTDKARAKATELWMKLNKTER